MLDPRINCLDITKSILLANFHLCCNLIASEIYTPFTLCMNNQAKHNYGAKGKIAIHRGFNALPSWQCSLFGRSGQNHTVPLLLSNPQRPPLCSHLLQLIPFHLSVNPFSSNSIQSILLSNDLFQFAPFNSTGAATQYWQGISSHVIFLSGSKTAQDLWGWSESHDVRSLVQLV